MSSFIQVPPQGQKITVNADMSLNVPSMPIIPFIEGDGTGRDVTPVMIRVVDAAVAKAYGGARQIQWMEVFAGEKAIEKYCSQNCLIIRASWMIGGGFAKEEMDFDVNDQDLCKNCNHKSFNDAPYGEDED